jgi:hypothetical protein
MPLRTLWLEVDILSSDESFGLPKMLLPAALRHQHVDYLNARRVQTLMHLHGSEGHQSDPQHDDPQMVDLDALVAEEKQSAQAHVA